MSMKELSHLLSMLMLTSQILSTITHKIPSLRIVISGSPHDLVEFFVFQSPTPQDILCFSWLKKHNPIIDRSLKTIITWSEFCSIKCLRSAVSLSLPSPNKIEAIDLSHIPSCYHDIDPVFSKSRALSLLSHHPYDWSKFSYRSTTTI